MKKPGRPKKKKANIKNHVNIRLNDQQKKILKLWGPSTQKGIDYLIQWSEKNYDLIINNSLIIE